MNVGIGDRKLWNTFQTALQWIERNKHFLKNTILIFTPNQPIVLKVAHIDYGCENADTRGNNLTKRVISQVSISYL